MIVGVVVAEPRLCEHNNAYIRVERPGGWRELGLANTTKGVGCTTLPAEPTDRTCETLNGGALLGSVEAELHARRIDVNGVGLGPCGKIGNSLAAWNLSIGVVDWHDAAMAVKLLAEDLDRCDVRDPLGVAVHGIDCGEAL